LYVVGRFNNRRHFLVTGCQLRLLVVGRCRLRLLIGIGCTVVYCDLMQHVWWYCLLVVGRNRLLLIVCIDCKLVGCSLVSAFHCYRMFSYCRLFVGRWSVLVVGCSSCWFAMVSVCWSTIYMVQITTALENDWYFTNYELEL
jgi:hypothetical protein